VSWELRIPYRSREDSLADVALDTAELDAEDARVTRQLVMDAIGTDATAGELIDRIERMSQAERRDLLDRTRVRVGMDTIADTEAHERFLAANRAIRPRPLQRCAVCDTVPTTRQGFPDLNVPPAKRWHCPAHEHLASAGDLDPPPSGVGLDMSPIPSDAELAREQRRDEQRRREHERRQQERRAEAEAIRKARERYEERVAEDDYVRPEIAGIRGARMDAR